MSKPLHDTKPEDFEAQEEPLALSDELPQLLDLASRLFGSQEILAAFGVVKVKLVVDANVVLSDLIFHVVHKRKPTARRALEELVACEVVEAIAPEFIECEVEKHLPRIAAKHGRPLAAFQAEWTRYRSVLTLVAANTLPVVVSEEWEALSARDPKDLPYLMAKDSEGARAVLTGDEDFPASVRAPGEVLIDLQGYARSKAVAVKIQVSGFIFAGLSTACVVPLVKAAARLIGTAAKMPAVQFAALAALLIAAVSPEVRGKISAAADHLIAETKDVWAVLSPALGAAVDGYMAAELSAREALIRAEGGLPVAD